MFVQELYGVRSDLGNLLKALGRLEEAKVTSLYYLPSCLSWQLVDPLDMLC